MVVLGMVDSEFSGGPSDRSSNDVAIEKANEWAGRVLQLRVDSRGASHDRDKHAHC
jgi:hypothetical protein